MPLCSLHTLTLTHASNGIDGFASMRWWVDCVCSYFLVIMPSFDDEDHDHSYASCFRCSSINKTLKWMRQFMIILKWFLFHLVSMTKKMSWSLKHRYIILSAARCRIDSFAQLVGEHDSTKAQVPFNSVMIFIRSHRVRVPPSMK